MKRASGWGVADRRATPHPEALSSHGHASTTVHDWVLLGVRDRGGGTQPTLVSGA